MDRNARERRPDGLAVRGQVGVDDDSPDDGELTRVGVRSGTLSGSRFRSASSRSAGGSRRTTTLPALAVVGLVPVPLPVIVGTAAVAALSGPVVAFTFGTLAANTIEGIALSKLANLAILAPVLAVAVAPMPVQLLAGVFPSYWPVKAFVVGTAGDAAWLSYLIVGVVAHLLALAVLAGWFGRRAD